MAKKVASVKQTGGGGFSFENKVTAYFLSCMLRDKSPLDPELGTITRIDFQVRVDGWFLDDILLTLNLNEQTHLCAFSVKSNQQFLSNSAPIEFVSIVWEQFLHEGTQKFDRENDFLGLITIPLNQTLSENLNSLMQKARMQDSAGLPTKLQELGYVNDLERDLFKSFACPEKFASTHGVTEAQIGELLKHIKFLEFDFERDNSIYKIKAIENCRDALTSTSLDEALFLWETLQVIADENRIKGGYFDLAKLVKRLKFRYRLKNYPDYDTDWKSLIAHTQSNLLSIPHKIGNKVIIDRGEEIRQIEEAFSSNVAIAVMAPSGYGKTVTAKFFGEKKLDCNEKAIWINAINFNCEGISTFKTKLHLKHSFEEILISITDNHVYLIIDGIDQIFSDYAFQNLCLILNQIGLNNKESPYKLLITCKPEDWDRVQTKLAHFNVPVIEWNVINLEISDQKLNTVFETFPELKRLKFKPHLRTLLFKPKILDILATKLSIGRKIDTSKWVGESDLIEWFWESEIKKPQKAMIRERFIQLVGEKQADNLEFGIPITEFSVSDLEPENDLEKDQILKEKEGRIYFYHEIYGDWARQKILISNERRLSEYLELKINSPIWLRALRLYGMYILEKGDLTKWHSMFDDFGTDDINTIQKDVLLESVIFTADPSPVLEFLWPDLAATEGRLLRRLLGRFLHSATIPNPRMLKMAKEQGLSVGKASTILRIPYWPYWLPILEFLHEHSNDVIKYAHEEIGQIAYTWLRLGQTNWPLRRETAELALDNATAVFNLQHENYLIIDKDIEKIVYTAALAAIEEIPERVETFALTACSRNSITKQRLENKLYEIEIDDKAKQTPWPDGPSKRVNSAFQDICLQTNALNRVIEKNPRLAREIILALLIKEPQNNSQSVEDYFRKDISIKNVNSWYPYLYYHGPFLFFLNTQPEEGLELILRLVNFATKRWDEERKKEGDNSARVVINLQDDRRELIGDYDVYFWYRDNIRCPGSVVVALMALEKWMYDKIEARDESIKEIMENILSNLESVALVGVLNAVGCKDPSLFIEGTIKSLIAVPEFHNWERTYDREYKTLWKTSWDSITSLVDKCSTEMAIKWHTLPHRDHGVHEISELLFLNEPHMRNFFENTRIKWLERFEEMNDEDEMKHFLQELIALYDIQNLSKERDNENKKTWEYNKPYKETAKIENSSDAEDSFNLSTTLIKCSNILIKGQVLSEEELEGLWQDAKRISNFTSSNSNEEVEINRYIIYELIAIFFENNHWIEKYPDRNEWCIKKILSILSDPPEPVKYDNLVSIYKFSWANLYVRIIPKIWASNPESQKLRQYIAILAMDSDYKIIETLFRESSKYRKTLGDNLKQLQHFIHLWSVAKTRLRSDSNFDISIWIEEEFTSFTNGSMTKEIPKWEKIEFKVPFNRGKPKGEGKTRNRLVPGLDLNLIKSAYNWLLSLDDAINENERLEWINFWKENLQYTLRILGNDIGDDEEIEGDPSSWDKWVFCHISIVILELKPSECPRDFWEPVLNLGVTGRDWVKNFLNYWFYNGIQKRDRSNTFLTQWSSMIDYALSSPKWNLEKDFRSREIWCNLIGLDDVVRDLWTAEQKYLIKQMHNQYKRWAEKNLSRTYCSSEFISFIQMPGAEDLVLDGLIWLDEVATDGFWNNQEIQKKLPPLLEMVWTSYQSRIRRKKEYFESFKNLLKGLVETQNPYAMELQDRISLE